MLRATIALAITLLSAACATQPPEAGKMVSAAAGQRSPMPPVKSETPTTVTVVRDIGLIGAAVYIHVSLDGKPLASLNPGEFFTFRIDPGEYQFGAIPTDPFSGHKVTALDVTWRSGQSLLYRVGFNANMNVVFARDPAGKALPD